MMHGADGRVASWARRQWLASVSMHGADEPDPPARDWLCVRHAPNSTGLTILSGCPNSITRDEDWHADIEIAIPGSSANARVTHHSDLGRKSISEVRGHHVSVIPQRQPHHVEWNARAELTVMFLSPKLVEQAATEVARGGLLHIHERYTAIDPVIRQLGLSALNMLRSDPGGTTLYLSSLAHVLALHLVQHYGVSKPPGAPSGSRLPPHVLRRATDFMCSNLASDIRLEDVASAAGMSPFHFAHLFKNTMGMGPHRYLTLARIERLKELLRGTETSLFELASILGFSDQSHMTSVFRRFTGMTPKAYRFALKG
jgi:AraC family transcriptional regulator